LLAGGSIVLLRWVMEVELEDLGEETVLVVVGMVDFLLLDFLGML
jgi:hypothetical protein